ncbi:MAG: sigma-70 family RNA polymerase sigma factor [Candidatus Latescibacteria bacterium]|nr:sigma-70 family RNA polymerase sigma factor [Candidatus Latescibacterota bacterium]
MSGLKSGSAASDTELFLEFTKGDTAAFNKIVNRYQGRLLNFVYRFTGDRETAQDIVQETFLRVYRKREQYCSTANLSTWIFTIAGNLAKSELRHRKRWHLVSIGKEGRQDVAEKIADQSLGPNQIAEKKAIERNIQEAIESLPPKYREAVILRDIEAMPYEQIAQIVGCPVGTAKSRVNRGRLQLQKKLEQIIDQIR